MPFTLIHGIFGLLAVRLFSKDTKLPALGFIGGIFPDIDAFPILFGNFELYNQVHRAVLHNVFAGILAGLVVALIAKRLGIDSKKAVLAFLAGFAAHLLLDAFFAFDLPLRPLRPLSDFGLSLFQGSLEALAAVNLIAGIIAAFLIFKAFGKKAAAKKTVN